MDKLTMLAGAAVIILVLFLACGLAALALFTLATPQAQNVSAPQNGSNATQPAPPPQQGGNATISPADYALWLLIDKTNVESACYEKAREEAGSNAWAVRGCTCSETATQQEKQYTCTVDTVVNAGTYFADIDCTLASAQCTVTTNFGSQNVTFEQLRSLYNSTG